MKELHIIYDDRDFKELLILKDKVSRVRGDKISWRDLTLAMARAFKKDYAF